MLIEIKVPDVLFQYVGFPVNMLPIPQNPRPTVEGPPLFPSFLWSLFSSTRNLELENLGSVPALPHTTYMILGFPFFKIS